jgi:small GTP-binding protein
MAQGMASVKD